MAEQTDWKLLARYLSGECSNKEKENIEKWINLNSDNKRLMKFMKIAWSLSEIPAQESDIKNLWNGIAEKSGIKANKEQQDFKSPSIFKWPLKQNIVYRVMRYAAVLVIMISLPYFIFNGFQIPSWIPFTSNLTTVTVAKGNRQKVILSDGTNIVLDAGSEFKYPEEFDSDLREVTLKGEGFFEVKPNPQKPFIIHANNAVVQVLGTKFNIRAWKENKKVEVVVAEGKVSLNSKNRDFENAVILTRGFSSILPENGLPTKPQQIDINKRLGWMHNEVIFDNAPLSEILFQLERWYDVQFELADTSVAAEHLTVHIQNQSLEDILELIGALTDLHYQRTGKSVYFEQREIN
jgi:ferric-dicitrate binding protein FerR (iron transport regulator)